MKNLRWNSKVEHYRWISQGVTVKWKSTGGTFKVKQCRFSAASVKLHGSTFIVGTVKWNSSGETVQGEQ